MSDTESTRRQQILDAALRVFARRGYDKATIKEIAAEAGVKSPALIYWYFPSKEELVRAVLRSLIPVLSQLEAPDFLMDLPPEQVFGMLSQVLLGSMNDPNAVQFFRVFFSESLRTPETFEQVAEVGPLRVLGFLINYLQRQIDTGRLRPHDPQVSARAFMGLVMILILSQGVFPLLGQNMPAGEVYMRDVIEIFLRGLRP